MPIGQLTFSALGTVEFKSISYKEMEAQGLRSAMGTTAEQSVRGSQRSFGATGGFGAVNSRKRVFASRTPYKKNKFLVISEQQRREAAAKSDEKDNYSYLSDFLRSQIDPEKPETRSTMNILKQNRSKSSKYNNQLIAKASKEIAEAKERQK